MNKYIDKSPENIKRIKDLVEVHTYKEVARLTGRSVEGIRDFLIRNNAVPENRKAKYKKATAKLYTMKPKVCTDCGKKLFWSKIYSKESRCQKCGHKKYFEDLRLEKTSKEVKVVGTVEVKVAKLVKLKHKSTPRFKLKLEERIKFLEKEIKKSQKELEFEVC